MAKKSAISAKTKEIIIVYLTNHAETTVSSFAKHIGPNPSRTRDYLDELIASEDLAVI